MELQVLIHRIPISPLAWTWNWKKRKEKKKQHLHSPEPMKMCLLMMWLLIGEARWIVKCTGLKTLLRQILQNWWDCTSLCKSIMTQSIQQKNKCRVSRCKEIKTFSAAKSVTWFQPSRACISVIKYKTEHRKTHKHAVTECVCSKGPAEQL